MTRIGKLFETLVEQKRCGMIAYLTAGDPTPESTPALVAALERGGADLIELGVPFSDPIADGPVIQQAGDRAIRAGTTLAKVLAMASEIRKTSEVPLLLFTYLNPALRYGFERLARDAKAAGIDGCLLTDVSVEEASEYVRTMREAELDTVFLAAPTSTDARLKLVAEYSSGFIYLVSRTGITGEQQNISELALPLIERMRTHTTLPLAMGFGISRPEHVAALAGKVEAVVVGSAVVRQIEQDPSKLEAFMRDLTRPLAKARDILNEMLKDPAQALGECRAQIDEVDLRILALLNERTAVAQEIGRIKRDSGMAIYEPRREDQVYQNVTSNNMGPLSNEAVKRVFERIIDEMRKVQKDRMEEPRKETAQ